jgi:hypothetical protein
MPTYDKLQSQSSPSARSCLRLAGWHQSPAQVRQRYIFKSLATHELKIFSLKQASHKPSALFTLNIYHHNAILVPILSAAMEEQRSNAEASISAAIDDARAELEILQGLRDARSREAKRRQIQLSPEVLDQLLEGSFPKIHPEEGKAKELTMDEFVALRTGLQEVIQSDVQEKMILLQDQLSEYHSVLEDAIAFKSRCERLEQEKKDLESLCHQACQVRDDKITLLEKELAQLRIERRRSSSSDGTSIGSGSECQYSLGYDHPQEGYHYHPQPIPSPAFTSRLPLMSDHCHHYYNEATRRITLSPSYVSNSRPRSSSSSILSVGAIQPLPFQFQESSAPMFSQMNQQGGFDNYSYLPRSDKNGGMKRHKHC